MSDPSSFYPDDGEIPPEWEKNPPWQTDPDLDDLIKIMRPFERDYWEEGGQPFQEREQFLVGVAERWKRLRDIARQRKRVSENRQPEEPTKRNLPAQEPKQTPVNSVSSDTLAPYSLYYALRAIGQVASQFSAALSPPKTNQELNLGDAMEPMADKVEGDLQKTVSVKTFESQAEADAIRSPDMVRFFQTIKRYDQASRAILSYVWHPQQYVSLIGAILGLGAVAMTGGFQTGKEILYLIVIGGLAAKAIHQHWRHERKKEIMALLICLSLLVFSGLMSWTEWQRHSEQQAVTTKKDNVTEQATTPQPLAGTTEPPKRISYSVNGKDGVDLKGAKVIAFHERSAWTYEGLVQDWHIIEINMPPGPYIITVFHENYGEFQGRVVLSITGKRSEPFNVDGMIELTPQKP